MKIRGKKTALRKEPVVFPRPGSEDGDAVLWLQAQESFKKYDEQCEQPKPEEKRDPKGNVFYQTEDPAYKKQLETWCTRFTYWLTIRSLEDCPENEIEWDFIDLDDPNTWDKIVEELADFGLNGKEAAHLVNKVGEINSINDAYLENARSDFLARSRREEKSQTL